MSTNSSKLVIRNAVVADLESVRGLVQKVYPHIAPYSLAQLRGQLNNFAEGQFVAEYDGVIVGYCATLRVNRIVALGKQSWREATGNGYASTHIPDGEYLYGMEVCVDPERRGLRIGERLYRARKDLCRRLRLTGIAFGGRIPGLRKNLKAAGSPENYLRLVQEKKLRDQVFQFHQRQGFNLLGLIEGYLPGDQESLGYATHMLWNNPYLSPEDSAGGSRKRNQLPQSVRLATVQYMQRRIDSFEEFEQIVTYFVDVVGDYRADFVCFPELFTLQLLSITNDPLSPTQAIEKLTEYTERIRVLFSDLAIRYNVNIIAGSHPTKMPDGSIENICFICLRDGAVHLQSKIHPTPNERHWWNIQGGDNVSVIQTDCGPIGVLICYDSEFPELARHLADQGALMLFVPFCTDERQGYLRVRYSCQARAVENQCYVVMSGNCGNLPRVHNMDIQYAQSCILTPCDFAFARDGIAADTTPNVEMVAFADLRLENLFHARNTGAVQNLRDRRHDLYSVTWHKHSVD
jgi:predicted amidohydrolase/ribosomal protein S18 acetylase RimI-like enzyme